MSMFIERTLDTEYGPINIAITRQDHISVQGQPVIRGTKFNCNAHFFRQSDGSYQINEKDTLNMSLSRAWVDGNHHKYGDPAPPTSRAKVLKAFTDALNEFMRKNENLALEAQLEELKRNYTSAEQVVKTAKIKLAEAQAASEAAFKALKDFAVEHAEFSGWKTLGSKAIANENP